MFDKTKFDKVAFGKAALNERMLETHKKAAGRISAAKGQARTRFKEFADSLERYVDKKLRRFYVTRDEYEFVKLYYERELAGLNQRIKESEQEKQALMNSTFEAKQQMQELSETAGQLLELNNQMRDALKKSMEEEMEELDNIPASEIMVRKLNKIEKQFAEPKHAKRKQKRS